MLTKLKLRKQTAIHWLIALGLGVVGTIQYFAAQFTSGFDTFFGDRGDVRGFVYFCEHWYQAFLGKTNLFSPAVFYPTKGTLAYSDLLLGFAVPYSFLRALGCDMFTAVEVVVILLTFLTYLVTFILLNRVLRFDLVPACAGAMFFAFSSPKFFQTGHLQLQFILFIPIIFILLISLYQRAARLSQARATALLALAGWCLMLQLVTTFYYAWFFVLWGVLVLAFALLLSSSRRYLFALIGKYWKAMFAAAGIFLIGFIPFLLIYRRTLHVGTWYSYLNVSEMIPEWWSFLSLGDGNYLWGRLSAAIRPEPWPATWGELMVGVGLVVTLMWLALTIHAVRLVKSNITSRPLKRDALLTGKNQLVNRSFFAAMILATTLLLLLGCKYWHGYSPWYLVYYAFPGAGAIRAMSRYVIFLTLPMAIGLAYATQVAMRWSLRQRAYLHRVGFTIAIALIVAFAIFEQFGAFKVGGTGFSKRAEKAYLQAMAAKVGPNCEAFYVTPGSGKHNPFEYQYDAMLISILSGVPTLNASSSQFPPAWQPLYMVSDPQYETHVKNWIAMQGLRGNICRLEIGPQFEAFDPRAPGPLDDPKFLVSQHYRDFLDREPTSDELDVWLARLQDCKNREGCDRAHVSLDIFRSTGFYDYGSFVVRLYWIGLGRSPGYEEFAGDLKRLRDYMRSDTPANAKLHLVKDLLNDGKFSDRYQHLADAEFVEKLLQSGIGSLSNDSRQALLAHQRTRDQILFEITESKDAVDKLTNRAFLTLQYFGYLRRDPEPAGFNGWLEVLDKKQDFPRVTSGFVNSIEYRRRFLS